MFALELVFLTSRGFFQFCSALLAFRRNLAAASASKSYGYLTKNDFIKAFGKNQTVLIAKDYKSIKVHIDEKEKPINVLLSGGVVKPTQVKLVNTEVKQNCDSNLLFCLDDMASDEEDEAKDKPAAKVTKKAPSYAARSQNLPLFRRRMKTKKLIEMETEEREKLASCVLDSDRLKNKSIFEFINKKQLVLPSDYDEPDFVQLEQPTDTDYEQSYSQQTPSVHELFDIDVDFGVDLIYQNMPDADEDYEMLEFLEDDDGDL